MRMTLYCAIPQSTTTLFYRVTVSEVPLEAERNRGILLAEAPVVRRRLPFLHLIRRLQLDQAM